jgi:predicted transcriptional regulator
MAEDVQKTTVYLDPADYRRLKAIARARGCAPAQLVREAVARYAASETPARRARSVGAGASRRGDLSERAEELLAGLKRR